MILRTTPLLQDASVENSDSAEEVAWAPRQLSDGDAAFAASLPRNMPQETSAAINLMAMSYKGEKGSRSAAPSSPHAQLLAVPQTDASVPFQDPQVGSLHRDVCNKHLLLCCL